MSLPLTSEDHRRETPSVLLLPIARLEPRVPSTTIRTLYLRGSITDTMTIMRSVFLMLLLAGLTGCYGSCSDYGDSLSTPQGCSCLENLYGCGPLDYPTGFGFISGRLAATKKVTNTQDWKLNLNRVSSNCPSLKPKLSSHVLATQNGRRWKIVAGSLGSATLTTAGRTSSGRVRRLLPSAGLCLATIDISMTGVPSVNAVAPTTVRGTVNCAIGGSKCNFVYRGSATR